MNQNEMTQNTDNKNLRLKQWVSYLIAVGPIIFFFVGLIIYTLVDSGPKDGDSTKSQEPTPVEVQREKEPVRGESE